LTRSPVRGSVICRLSSPGKPNGHQPYRLHELLQRRPTFVCDKPLMAIGPHFSRRPTATRERSEPADRLRDR
jgi:hypothetical protein